MQKEGLGVLCTMVLIEGLGWTVPKVNLFMRLHQDARQDCNAAAKQELEGHKQQA